MNISFIAAVGENREIGFGNELPWHLPDDLKKFKEITKGHTVIMGRKTYESMGKVLPDRKNIIITRNKNYKAEGAVVVSSLEKALKEVDEEEAFVIGGGEIFELALPYANRMYLTHVKAKVKGDSFFPDFKTAEWEVLGEEFHPKDEKHIYDFMFKTYKRKLTK
ncbi:MAG: dihydrofolate reductase [Candidatus Nomurabacteria bacterium]|nr:dihydrofolate reductase [Candidatus Nomurabacteria bacterium]